MKICSTKYIHGPKSKTREIINEVFTAFTHIQKVEIGSFIKARIRIRFQMSGSGFDQKVQIRLDPDPQH
jgi:hypothetical protein